MRTPLAVSLSLALLLFAGFATAQEFPQLTNRVVDGAEIISESVERNLIEQLAALEAATSIQLVVATVTSLDGRDIRDYGVELARLWELGQQDEEDGLLLLVAPNERKVTIEVGYGLEGDIPDVIAKNIIDTRIIPHFFEGNYEGGIAAGVLALQQAAVGELEIQQPPRRTRSQRRGLMGLLPLLWVPFALMFVGGRLFRRGRRGERSGGLATGLIAGSLLSSALHSGGSSSGSFGGGFGGGFSGGGGSFGGGGASGSW